MLHVCTLIFQYDIHKNALKSHYYYPDLIEVQNAPLRNGPSFYCSENHFKTFWTRPTFWIYRRTGLQDRPAWVAVIFLSDSDFWFLILIFRKGSSCSTPVSAMRTEMEYPSPNFIRPNGLSQCPGVSVDESSKLTIRYIQFSKTLFCTYFNWNSHL